jgi:hypothetical protein
LRVPNSVSVTLQSCNSHRLGATSRAHAPWCRMRCEWTSGVAGTSRAILDFGLGLREGPRGEFERGSARARVSSCARESGAGTVKLPSPVMFHRRFKVRATGSFNAGVLEELCTNIIQARHVATTCSVTS